MMQLIQRIRMRLNSWAYFLLITFASPISLSSGTTDNKGVRKRRDILFVPMIVIAAAIAIWVLVVGLEDEFPSAGMPIGKGSCWGKLPLTMMAGFAGMLITAMQSMFWRKTIRPLWLLPAGGVASGALVILTYHTCWPAASVGLAICVSAYAAIIAVFAKMRTRPR